MEKTNHANPRLKKATLATKILKEAGFRIKTISRNEDHFIMTKGQFYQKDIILHLQTSLLIIEEIKVKVGGHTIIDTHTPSLRTLWNKHLQSKIN